MQWFVKNKTEKDVKWKAPLTVSHLSSTYAFPQRSPGKQGWQSVLHSRHFLVFFFVLVCASPLLFNITKNYMTKLTILKCTTVQWHFIHSQCCATTTYLSLSRCRTFCHPQRKPCTLAVTPYPLPPASGNH